MAKQSRKNTGRTGAQPGGTGSSARSADAGAHAPRSARRPESVRQRKEARQKAAAKEQRNRMLVRAGGAAVLVLLVVAIAVPLYNRFSGPSISGDVTTYFSASDFVGVHPGNVTEILYEEVPPVGGPHNAVWQNCGFYDKYIFNWHGVHALEHGAVWITYDPNLPQADKDKLKKLADQGYLLISPYPGLPSPVVASVWGKQMDFTGVNDDRLDTFIKDYKRNPNNTPEPRAVCWGGTSLTTDQEPQQQPYQRVPGTAPIGGVTSIDATATAEAEAGKQAPASSPAAPVATPAASPKASPEGAASTPAS